MKHFSERELTPARTRRSEVPLSVLAAFVLMVGWLATARADIGALPGAGGSVEPTTAQSPQSGPYSDATAPPQIVAAPPPPNETELRENGLYDFIANHATTHFVNTSTMGNLARWRGGLQSICPLTIGLTPGFNAFVTARLRALAAYVGAPVLEDPQCKSNVHILFTSNPQAEMHSVTEWATAPAFHNRYAGGMRDLIAFRSDHAIQGWYMTTGEGARVLNTDVAVLRLNVLPIWPEISQHYVGNGNTGTRLGGGSGSGIGIVILVVDTTKVVGYAIGTIADYLAMLTLSVAQSPDHCDSLPSILDLMSSSCGTREAPTAMTAGDLAFLKALYYKNTGLGPSLSRAEIGANMMRQFEPR